MLKASTPSGSVSAIAIGPFALLVVMAARAFVIRHWRSKSPVVSLLRAVKQLGIR
jgi:hypothetical protein